MQWGDSVHSRMCFHRARVCLCVCVCVCVREGVREVGGDYGDWGGSEGKPRGIEGRPGTKGTSIHTKRTPHPSVSLRAQIARQPYTKLFWKSHFSNAIQLKDDSLFVGLVFFALASFFFSMGCRCGLVKTRERQRKKNTKDQLTVFFSLLKIAVDSDEIRR